MPQTRNPLSLSRAGIAVSVICALTVWAYSPGLSGGFLFDDFGNINALGATGPVDNWQTFWRYVTSGNADPTGRPVALLSFLIDGNTWPTSPYPFKRTNLIIHLLNGLLLAGALWRLSRITAIPQKAAATSSILAAAIWLLHPLMVSTTLYIVQRQAMLPATFFLLGLHGWIEGRILLQRNADLLGATCMIASLGLSTALATLSKGNGVLIPALIGVIELFILRHKAPHPANTKLLNGLSVALLLTPALVVLAYLVSRVPGVLESTPTIRPWTLGQRLLTESRILIEYLSVIWVPRPFTAGLYNDNVLVSTSLIAPWTTLPSVVFVVSAPLAAWIVRKSHPLASAAIFFFWIGHTVESTVIPLELYYEHRNYLPSLMMFWPFATWLAMPGRNATARLTLSALMLLALASMTHARASLWGDEKEQALVWAALNPDSARAQATAALHEMHMNRPDLAYSRLSSLEGTMSGEVQIAFNRLGASCRMGSVQPGDLDAAATAVRSTKRGSNLSFKWMDRMVGVAGSRNCRGLTLQALERLVDIAAANPQLNTGKGREQEFLNIKARIELARTNVDAALAFFNAALDARPSPSTALKQAATLGQAGYPQHALNHLEHFEHLQTLPKLTLRGMPKIHQWVLEKQGYWTAELQHLKKGLREDLASSPQQN